MKKRITLMTAVFALFAILALPMGMKGQTRADEVYSTCRFGSAYNPNNTSYTGTFTVTNGNYTWTVGNGNNNNNGWTNADGYGQVKFGRKNIESVGYIATDEAYSEAITKVELTIDAFTNGKINSIKLYTGTSESSMTEAGSFTIAQGVQTVALSTPTSGLYYKIEFDCASGSNNGLITVSKVDYYHSTGGNPVVVAPTFTPNGGSFLDSQEVSIACATDGATIYYTLDGNDPSTSSTQYTAPFTLTQTTTVKAIAIKDSYDNSDVATAVFTKTSAMTVAEAIAATPSTGNVYIQGIVSSFFNTSILGDGASYRYYISDDGTTTTQLLVYKGNGLNNNPFTNMNDLLVGDQVIIYGTLVTYQNAPEVAAGNYIYSLERPATAVEAPTFNPAAGTYAETQTVTISCPTTGASIYYTTDGTEPTNESTEYTAPIDVETTVTIKAIAYVNDENSTVTSANYFICSADDPFSVTEALGFQDYQYPANNIYVHGIVSTAPTSLSSGTLTYYISADGEAEDQLEVYKGKGLENAAFESVDDIQVGDIVTIYGNVQVYNSTIEFGSGNYLVSFERPQSTEPSITVNPNPIEVNADEHEGTLNVTYQNIDMDFGTEVYWYLSDGETETDECNWIVLEFDDNYNINYVIDANMGEARTVYMKIYGFGTDETEVYSDLITFSQEAYVAPALDYATLPFEFDGGRADIENTNGLTQEGIDSDYGSSPKLKFNSTGDYLLLHFNETPGKLSFNIKNNSFSGGTFTVQTSEDGETFTDLETYTTIDGTQDEEFFLDENVRYVKWIYTEKVSGNVGLGNIVLAKPAPFINVNPDEVTMDAKEHDGTMAIVYQYLTITDMNDFGIQYYAEGEEASEPDWIEVLVAEEQDGSYVVSYYMMENEGEAREVYFKVFALGDEDYVYSNLITISQAAPAAPTSGDDYELFTGNLVEGDYLIVYNGKAMNNTVTSNRLQYAEVTATDDVIKTDDATIVWHIAPSGDYWTIFSADANKYAASTGTKNQATMSDDGTDDKALWTLDGTYEFVNKYNSEHDINAYLRNNTTYGFACYASSTGGSLALYKKVESAPETYTLEIKGYKAGSNGGYYLIASPVSVDPATVVGMTDGNYDLYYFDAAEEDEWQNYKQGEFNLEPGKGYLYAKQATTEGEVFQFELSGTPYNNQPIILNKTEGGDFPSWNLVGNPFGETAYVDRDFYVMKEDGSEIIEGEGNAIEKMQGFFVIATEEDEELNITTEAPANTGSKITVNVSQNRGNVIDRAAIRVDNGRNMPKFMLNPNNTKLYIPQNGEQFAVVRSERAGRLPIVFKPSEDGEYTFSINTENLNMLYLHLIDHETGRDIDLLRNPSYRFFAKTNNKPNRFELEYKSGLKQFKEKPMAFKDNFGYYSNGEIVINGTGDLQVFDLNGRLIKSETVNGDARIQVNATAGIYMMQLITNDSVMTQKVVVK